MKKILFNNIGNRHLYIEKPENGDYLYNEKTNFRKRTKEILENWDEWKDQVNLNILNRYLEDEKAKRPEIIYLFVTDQGEENKYNKQDTFYAGEIVKKLLQEKYGFSDKNIRIIKIQNINPSDENALFKPYAQHFKSIYYQDPETEWYFLDAGGTPQQKLVCKLLMSAIRPTTEIEYLKNVEGISENELISKSIENLERYFIMKSVEQLNEKLYYTASKELAQKSGIDKKLLSKLLTMGSQIELNIIKDIPFGKKDYNKGAFLKDYREKIPPVNFPALQKLIDKEKDFFQAGFLFVKANTYLEQENFNDFVMSFHRAMEIIINALYNKYNPRDYKNTQKDAIEASLPDKLDSLIQNLQDEKVLQFIKLFAEINNGYQKHKKDNEINYGIDSLRNKLAHEGKNVESIHPKIREVFKKMIGKEFLNTNTEYFKDLNALIKDQLYSPNLFETK